MCLLVGCAGVGKTLLLKRLQACSNRGSYEDLEDPPSTIPTVGTNLVNILNNKRQEITVRELGGAMASIWHNYYDKCEGLIFMVDMCNKTQISATCIQLLDALTSPKLRTDAVLLVLNKVDLPNALPRKEYEAMVRLCDIMDNCSQKITVIETSAREGQGLEEVANWIQDHTRPNN